MATKACKGAGGIGAAGPGASGVTLPLGPLITAAGGAVAGGGGDGDNDGVRKKKRGKLSDTYNAAPFTDRRVPCAKCARAFAYWTAGPAPDLCQDTSRDSYKCRRCIGLDDPYKGVDASYSVPDLINLHY